MSCDSSGSKNNNFIYRLDHNKHNLYNYLGLDLHNIKSINS